MGRGKERGFMDVWFDSGIGGKNLLFVREFRFVHLKILNKKLI